MKPETAVAIDVELARARMKHPAPFATDRAAYWAADKQLVDLGRAMGGDDEQAARHQAVQAIVVLVRWLEGV